MSDTLPRIWLILLLSCAPVAAWAQQGHHGHGHAQWHESFYSGLQSPKTKFSCCNLSDCRPTSGRMVGDHYEVQVNGNWVSVPWDVVVRKAAPDMGFHVCAPANFDNSPERLYCVVLPPEM